MKYLLHHLLSLMLTGLLLGPTCYATAQVDTSGSVTLTDTSGAEQYEEKYETGQSTEEDTATVETAINPYSRIIPADTIAAFKRNASFAYMASLDSLLRAKDQALRNQPPPIEDNGPSLWDSGVIKFICYCAAIGLVIFVLYKLFAGQGFFFSNKKTRTTLPAVELDETTDESDLEKALQAAIGRKDYRLAVRYLFLQSLQRLGERGAVQLSSDKTNYQYATELAGKPFADRFARLSLQYEYVWFGDFQISETQFSTIQQQHRQFIKEV